MTLNPTSAPKYRPSLAYEKFADPYGQAKGAPYCDVVTPAAFPKTVIRCRNDEWAGKLGLEGLSDEEWIDHFARFKPLPQGQKSPLAMRYHGHQFRSYNTEIGDGRGFLFAQLKDDQDRLLDFGTKGSGQTPYSRFGDGRLTLKGAVRELLATEMLEALGVYTSKTFSIIETGEALERNDEPSPTRSAVLVRLGHSHIRIGTFQRLAYYEDKDALAALVDYCVDQYDLDLQGLATDEKTVRFFERVLRRSARLNGQWLAAGFVHGVLNTDNMNMTGESFDYGPWRFIPVMDPNFTAAYFDQTGLYAYGRQAEAVVWNLTRFGGALLPLTNEEALNEVLKLYPAAFEAGMAEAFFNRLGLQQTNVNDDFSLVARLMQWAHAKGVMYEQIFFDWFCGELSADRRSQSPLNSLYQADDFQDISQKLLAHTPVKPERLEAPYFQRTKPVTMLIDTVEALWDPIAEKDDWGLLQEKRAEIAEMRSAHDFDASAYIREGA